MIEIYNRVSAKIIEAVPGIGGTHISETGFNN